MSVARSVRRHVFASLSAMVGCALVASMGMGGAAGAAAKKPGKPVKGGQVVYLHNNEPRSFDPATTTGTTSAGGDSQQQGAVYDFLLVENFENGKVVPRLAQSLTSTDAINWVLK